MIKKDEILLLNEPFGYNRGTGVTIKYHGNMKNIIDYKKFSELLLGFSCYPPAIPKIYNCLKYSGEYTCFLQSSWFESRSYDLTFLLKEINMSIDVFFFVDEKTKKSTYQKYEISEKNSLKNFNNEVLTKKLFDKYIEEGRKFFHQ